MVILSINLVSFSLYNYPLKGGLSLKKSRLLSVFFKFIMIVLGIGIIYSIVVLSLIISGTKDVPTSEPNTVLILGAQVKGENKEKAYPSKILKERLDAAIPYLEKHPEATVIVCGGQGTDEPDSEANVMANYLIKQGIPEEKIIREDTSTRTKENIQNAQKKQDLNNTLIVTSDYHVYRGKLLAKRLGIKEVSGLPAPSYKWLIINNYFRETIALGYALIFD